MQSIKVCIKSPCNTVEPARSIKHVEYVVKVPEPSRGLSG